MSPPRKGSRNQEKSPIVELHVPREEEEEEIETRGASYDDTKCLIDKETTFKSGEIYQMFNNQIFPQASKQDQDLEVFKAIKRSKLWQPTTISWVVKHTYLEIRHIINAKR
jgi:hypothetical protein